MLKEIMTNAWEIAKNAAKKFGGKAIEYISGALKMAWKMAKGLTNEQIKVLESKGFNRWTKYGKDRLYFDMLRLALWKSATTRVALSATLNLREKKSPTVLPANCWALKFGLTFRPATCKARPTMTTAKRL